MYLPSARRPCNANPLSVAREAQVILLECCQMFPDNLEGCTSTSEPWASFFISAFSMTTSDFFNICSEYWWLMGCGTAFDKGERLLKYLVSIRLSDTDTTRFSFTCQTSSCVGRKDSHGSDITSVNCLLRLRESGGGLLRAARMLYMYSILPWWLNRSLRTPTFLSTLSPKVLSSASTSRRVEE